MAFLTPTTPPTPAQILNDNIINVSNNAFVQLSNIINSLFNQIWNNADQANLSPDKSWAALGVNAVKIRTAFQGIIAFLNEINPGSISLVEPSNYTIVQNSDGSITCTKNS